MTTENLQTDAPPWVAEARRDLGTVSAERWVQLYGARLLDRLDETTRAVDLGKRVFLSLGAGIIRSRAFVAAARAAMAVFKYRTGWSPGNRKPTKAARWQAAQELAETIESRLQQFGAGPSRESSEPTAPPPEEHRDKTEVN